LSSQEAFRPDSQHDRLHFVPIHDVLTHPEIHEFTKNYFVECPPNAFLDTARQPLLKEQG
jgi:hypothetical protein